MENFQKKTIDGEVYIKAEDALMYVIKTSREYIDTQESAVYFLDMIERDMDKENLMDQLNSVLEKFQ